MVVQHNRRDRSPLWGISMEYLYKDLVGRAKGGCNKSMEDLIEKLQPLIYSVVGRYRDRREAEDLYQDACVLVIEAVRDYEEEKGVPFLGFAKSRVYFGIHNMVRKDVFTLSLDQPYGDGDGKSLLDQLVDESEGMDDYLIRKEVSRLIRSALENLTPKQRDVIEGYYFEEKLLKDMALDRGVHYKAVLKLKGKAMEKLRKELEGSIQP